MAAPASGAGEEEWLDARVVERLCTQAELEIQEGEPGDAARRLDGMTDRVREEWGHTALWSDVYGGWRRKGCGW
ncbi:hypothetical protein HEP87_59765 [Streptomyces sp. S1D4-11]